MDGLEHSTKKESLERANSSRAPLQVTGHDRENKKRQNLLRDSKAVPDFPLVV
jgi:hypothetical protein